MLDKILDKLSNDAEIRVILILIIFTLTVFMCDKSYKDGYNSKSERNQTSTVEEE